MTAPMSPTTGSTAAGSIGGSVSAFNVRVSQMDFDDSSKEKGPAAATAEPSKDSTIDGQNEDSGNEAAPQAGVAESTHPAVAFLREFYGDDRPWQLTAIGVPAEYPGDQGVRAITLSSKLYSDPVKRAKTAVEWIERHNKNGADLYFSPNPLVRAMSTKASKADVAGAEWLYAELDPPEDATVDRPDYSNRTPEAVEAWQEQVRKVRAWRAEIEALFVQWSREGLPGGLPKPSIVIDSGRGFWVYWRLAELISFMGEDRAEAIARVEAHARGIIQAFEGAAINAKVDHAVKNVDRIARLPGTRNWRTLWTARVVAFNPHAYALSDFPAVVIGKEETREAEPPRQEQRHAGAEDRAERTSSSQYSRDGRRLPSVELMREIILFLIEQDYFKNYHAWVEAGMALRLAYLDDGEELWALTHWPHVPGKDKNSPEELHAKWASFDTEPGPGQKTIGTLIWAARKAGFNFGPDLSGWAENVGGEGGWSLFGDGNDDYPCGSNGRAQTGDPIEAAHIIRPEEYLGLYIPPRDWFVRDYIPYGVVTGLYAPGGTGKSLLAQQTQTCAAVGAKWFGLETMQVKSFGIYCEDDQEELLRRQAHFNSYYGADAAGLSNMRMVSRIGMDNLLMTFTQNGVGELTRFHKDVVEEARDMGARLVVIDGAQDTFGGNEIDRPQVRQYIQRALGSIGQAVKGAVFLTCHPSRAGIASGQMYGGATAWENGMRSRLTFSIPEQDAGAAPDPDARVLKRNKANYAPKDAELNLRYRNGVFIPDGFDLGEPAVATSRPTADEVFLEILANMTSEGRPVSDNNKSSNYAPKKFSERPERQGYKKDEFKLAMERLFKEGKIRPEAYGRKGDERQKIVSA